jgi:hypothetical protein
MYHPLLTFAVAQARIDDLTNDVRHDRTRRHPTAAESYDLDLAQQRAGFGARLSRFAVRRVRPSAA